MLNIYILNLHFLENYFTPYKDSAFAEYIRVMLTPTEVFLTPADLIARAKPKHDSLQHFEWKCLMFVISHVPYLGFCEELFALSMGFSDSKAHVWLFSPC